MVDMEERLKVDRVVQQYKKVPVIALVDFPKRESIAVTA